MDFAEIIRQQQERIRELTASLSVWLNSTAAQDPEVQALVDKHQEQALTRLQELEVEGQKAKIASMEAVLSLLKGETKP